MDTKSLVLPSILDLKAATPLVETLLPLRGGDLLVDASNAERLGGQCLQVLVSAVATWQADGFSLEFAKPSDAFIEGLAVLGTKLEDLLAAGHVPAEAARSVG
ncbi:MAG: STAS domain-containing protein [Beijerinckiaceae bacterium]